MQDIYRIIFQSEYDFLRFDQRLSKNIMFLVFGGSYAYGTNVETSDIDIRGVALPSEREVLTGKGFEQVTDGQTDTCIYEFRKVISLLSACNPNVIEMLGCRPQDYALVSDAGRELLDHKDLFLSKRAASSFGGYANAQFSRLQNRSFTALTDKQKEEHILSRIKSAAETFPEKYFSDRGGKIDLYIDKAVDPEKETEIFMDIDLTHYPLRDYKCMWSEMHDIVKNYAKLGKRNESAMRRGVLGKHMCHLVRLLVMGIQLLNEGKVVTYRKNEHDLLMALRNGEYLGENGLPNKDFFEIVSYLEEEFRKAKETSPLPKRPDEEAIDDLVCRILKEHVITS